MTKKKPTKEQFEEYVAIRDSGVTNMFNVTLIEEISWTGLTREECFYIMDNFKALAEEFEVEI